MNNGAVKNPRAITFRKEKASTFLDPFEHGCIRSSTDALSRQKPRAPRSLTLDLLPSLLEPIATQVGFRRNTLAPQFEQAFHVVVAEFGAHPFSAQKRRIPHDKLRLRPFRLLRVLR